MATRKQRPRGEGAFYYDERTGLWTGEVDLGYAGGKRKRKRVTSKNQKTALKKFREAREAVDAGRTGRDSTLAVWLEEWLADIVEVRRKPKTARTYRTYVERYLIPILGHVRLSKIEPRDVRHLHREMRRLTTRRGGRMSETTIHHAHRVLLNALGAAVSDGKPIRAAVLKEPAPSMAPSTAGALTRDQARRVLTAAAEDPRMWTRWLAAFELAARQGECLGLRWSYVDLDTGLADLAWSLQRIHYVHGCRGDCEKRAASCPKRHLAVPPGFDYQQLHGTQCLIRPKNEGSTRVVPLPPLLHEALRRWREIGAGEPNPHDLVWRYPDGRPIDGRRDYNAWVALLEKADVPHFALHEARHTASTLLGEAGASDRVRMEILGHSVVATANRYRHVNVTESRAALTAVEAELLEGD